MTNHCIGMTARAVILSAVLAAAGAADAAVRKSEIVPSWKGAEAACWTFDYEAATNNAARDETGTLLLFSGMWWCPHCQALEENVFLDEAWQSYVAGRGLYEAVLDYPGRNGKSNWCWLWETNYVEAAGMTMAEAAAEQVRRYSVQDAFAGPDAARQEVVLEDGTAFSYGKIGYPTLLVLRADGKVAGRFSVSRANASLDYVTNRVEQALGADAWDEADDRWQAASELEAPSCEDEEIFHGDHTLSAVDAADWYRVDVSSGVGGQWTFSFGEHPETPAEDVLVELYECPTNAPVASQVVAPGVGGDFSCVPAKGGDRWLKVSPARSLQRLAGYSLSYQYALSPATISFASTNVTARATDKSVTLSVRIADASRDAEVVVDWAAEDGDARFGEDYGVASGTLTWPVGSVKRAQSISIPLVAQTEWKGDRSFTVRLYPRRHCVVSKAVAECRVNVHDNVAKKPGTLSFDAAAAKVARVVREGETVEFDVFRTGGRDGVVTGVVSLVVGRQTEVLANLVWAHHDEEAKKFSYTLPELDSFREDTSATLRLTALGGARVATGTARLTLRDALVEETFADYNRRVTANALSVSGVAWFAGWLGSPFDGAVVGLRSRPLGGKKTTLTYRVKGPAVVEVGSQAMDGAAAELFLGAKRLTDEFPARVAVPTGSQTLKLSATGDGDAYVTAEFRTVSLADWRLEADLPRSGQAVVLDEGLSLVGRAADATAPEPGVRFETLVGTSASRLTAVGTNDFAFTTAGDAAEATFPQTAEEREAFEAVAATRLDRALYWRMDAVFADEFGNRAVQAGVASSVTLREAGCPAVAWDRFGAESGWTADAARSEAAFAELTVGVEANVGPIPLDGVEDGDVVSVSVRNGRLPTGVRAVVDDGGVWLRGVPNKAGEFDCELMLSARVVRDGRRVTAGGASCRLTAVVRELGDVAAAYDGYAVMDHSGETATPGCGTATFTVSKAGAVSGKLVLDGTNVSFSAKSWTARTNETFYLSTTAKVGKTSVPLALAVEAADEPEAGVDAQIAIGGRLYWLNRNRWKTAEGKERVAPLVGQYVAALLRSSGTDGAPEGTGYVSLSVKADGTVAYSGFDSLGVAFSGKSVLYYALDCCNTSGFHWGFYLYARPSGCRGAEDGVYGLVEILPGDDGYLLSSAGEAPIRNVWSDGSRVYGGCAWTNALEAVGGVVPGTGLPDSGSWSLDEALAAPADFDGRDGEIGYELVSAPEGLVLSVSAKGKPEVEANDWNAKMSAYAAKTGISTLRFDLTYAQEAASGKTQTKRRSLTSRGVYVPVSELGVPFWAGFYVIPEKVEREVNGKARTTTVQTPFSWLFR